MRLTQETQLGSDRRQRRPRLADRSRGPLLAQRRHRRVPQLRRLRSQDPSRRRAARGDLDDARRSPRRSRCSSVLDGTAPTPVDVPDRRRSSPRSSVRYDFSGTKLTVTAEGKRLYIEGPGEPRHRMLPLSATEFWLEPLQAAVIFQKEDDKVAPPGVRDRRPHGDRGARGVITRGPTDRRCSPPAASCSGATSSAHVVGS